jgi:hypothetical protein
LKQLNQSSRQLFMLQLFRALALALLLLIVTLPTPLQAQEGETADVSERPFQLPFAEAPSPDTWLMAQPYGSTTGSYRQRFTTYGASGGIHFGVDLSAPCGTEIVAIADGVVFAVDGPFGSPPHNLMIDHPELGYASMYGHLLEAPDLQPGQQVKQGEVIAKTGDSAELCYRRPHLHLEIRDLAHVQKFNPTLLIEADWDNLTMFGSSGRDFARDLDEPRKWQSLYDQPVVRTAGPIVNDFPNPWPPDWEKAIPAAGLPFTPTVTLTNTVTISSTGDQPNVGRQLTSGDCCTQLYWNQESTQVRFIDQPQPDVPVGVWAVDVTSTDQASQPQLVTPRLGYYSPDRTLFLYPDPRRGVTVFERLADGTTWEVDTQSRRPIFSPDSQRVIWTAYDEDAPRDTRVETLWTANRDGSDVRRVLQSSRTDAVAWLNSDTLLMARRVAGSADEDLFTLSLLDSSQEELLRMPPMQGVSLSEAGRYLVYYTRFEPNLDNGLWLLDMENIDTGPQKLPFFGSYRWLDNERLVYIPFDPEAETHDFYEYNVETGQNQKVFPNGTGMKVANNDWRVSPDSSKIALLRANGSELDGIWVLPIETPQQP